MERRIKFLIIFFLFCFLAILSKFFYWQIVKRKFLLALASNQQNISFDVPSSRGKIYSKDNFPLVLNQQTYLLFADPSLLKISASELSAKLKPIIEKDTFDIKSLSDKNFHWVSLAKNLPAEKKRNVESLKIEGLGFEESEIRYYPEASMSAHLLGFVGEDDKGIPKGYFGLEGFYDNEIKGKFGSRTFEQDALGRPVPLSEELIEKPIAGRNFLLNLDRPLQFLVEKRLKEGIEKYSALSGTVLVMDPENGAILAMASFPNFSPASFFTFDSELFRNPSISSAFEPGSIFKVIIMASAIDSGKISPDETCNICYGPRTIGEYTIKTWNEKYYPNSSMTDIIVHSDNVGMVYVGQKLGKEKMYDYLRKFGFGQITGIDLQGEVSPQLRNKNAWGDIDLATASFGQGIAVTSIQLLTAVSAIANGGEYYEPQVVNKIFDDFYEATIDPVKKRRVITEQTAQILTQMMVTAVEKGEAKWAKPKGYEIAGKTGTAQIPIAGHYDPEKTVASFVGFAPAGDPKFVMLVSLNEPKSSPWGSETAAPLWFNIAGDIFKLLGVSPG